MTVNHGSTPTKSSDDGIWRANLRLNVPELDIVTFAFGRYNSFNPDQPVYIDAKNPSKYVTMRVALRTVKQLASGLKAHGLKPGDCVSVHTFNNISFPLLWLGIIAAGGCPSGSNPAYALPELVHHLTITNTKFFIIHNDCLDTAISAAQKCRIPPSNLFAFNDDCILNAGGRKYASSNSPCTPLQNRHNALRSLLACGETSWGISNHHDHAKKKVATLAVTSGTTGLPKAAAISHRYLVAQALLLENQFIGRANQVRQLMCLPVFHAFASQLALVLPLRLGIPTYFLSRFRLDDYVQAVSKFSITDSALVPPIISSLLGLDKSQHGKLQSLRYVICAGAPMNPEVQNKLHSFLSSKAVIAQCWGTTEIGWATLFGPSECDISGSVGRLLPNTELKIIDPVTGLTLSREGEIGEACIRSPSILMEYVNNPSANARAIDMDGFYHTGDRVYFQNGKLFIQGRIADTLKVNGWQVSPEELETVLNRHPQIDDSAVVGITRKDASGLDQTLPRAYVVLKCDEKASESEIKAFVSSQVIGYKRLTGGVVFVSSIPRNSTGKILRRLLIDK